MTLTVRTYNFLKNLSNVTYVVGEFNDFITIIKIIKHIIVNNSNKINARPYIGLLSVRKF